MADESEAQFKLGSHLEGGCESSDFEDEEDRPCVPRVPRPYTHEPYASESDSSDTDEPELCENFHRLNNTHWCSCGLCLAMPKPEECCCCKEIPQISALMEDHEVQCITQHPGFHPVCLDVYVLKTAYFSYRQQYNKQITDENNRHRYTSYRQLARFAWGYLGKDIRVVLPACAVMHIRKTFPSSDGQYTGYLEPEK